jgi:hypothetical protein
VTKTDEVVGDSLAPVGRAIRTSGGRPGPVGVFLATWLAYAAALLTSSRDLFTRMLYEHEDSAAFSIQVLAAKDLELLVGHYSRIGFHHPGPVLIYVQALGEWLFYDLLRWVPTPWNGQAIAILLLNAAMMALALSVVYIWYPSWTLIVGLGGMSLLFVTAYRELLSDIWFPYVYFAMFLVFLIGVSSVVAGRTEHLWVVALAGGLLVHGNAAFLFFVPLLGGAALYLVWRRKMAVACRDRWLFGAVVAVFAAPVVVNTIVDFPGEFPKYVGYGGGHEIHMPWTAASYLLQFWGPNRLLGFVILVLLFALVALVARGERFLVSGLSLCAASVVLMLIYVMVGIDLIDQAYIGYFSYAVPLFMFMLLLIGITRRVERLKHVGVALLVIGIAVVATTQSLANRRHEVHGIPDSLAGMVKVAGDRPIILERRPHLAWAEVVALVLAGARGGVRVCADDGQVMKLVVTDEFVCTPNELTTGVRFIVSRRDAGTPIGQVVAEMGPLDGSEPVQVTTALR